MSVRKVGAKWVADVTVGRRLDGSRDRRTVTCATKAEAERAERRLLVEADKALGRSYGGITFAEFVEHWFWPQKAKLRPTTVKGYRRDLKLRLLPAFGGMAVGDIGRQDVQRMLFGCATRKVATNARETLSSVLRLAEEMGVVPRNVAAFRYEYPDSPEPDPDRMGVWLTDFAEIRRVVEFVADRWPDTPVERMTVLGLCLGLRKSEVLGLERRDIDLGAREVSIERGYTLGAGGSVLGPPKTPKARRRVPMSRLAAERIAAWDMADGAVILSKSGSRMTPSTAQAAVNAVYKAGHAFGDGEPLPALTQFSMRHSFGTACIEAGVEVAKVSAWMGHCDVTTTLNRYVKPRRKSLAKGMAIVDEAMGL